MFGGNKEIEKRLADLESRHTELEDDFTRISVELKDKSITKTIVEINAELKRLDEEKTNKRKKK